MTIQPDIAPEMWDGGSSEPAPKPKPKPEETAETKWDNAVTYMHTRENSDGYSGRVRKSFNAMLEDKEFHPTLAQLTQFFAHGNGENDTFEALKEKLINRAVRHGVDLTENDGAFIKMLAEHGKRLSIGAALQTTENWSESCIETALNIALEGDKPGTTSGIVRNAPIAHLAKICDIYFKHEDSKARNHLQDEALTRIGRHYNSIDKLYDGVKAAPHSLKQFLFHFAKKELKTKWCHPNDKEASFKVEAHGISITRIFNFKAEHVHIATHSGNGLVAEIKPFDEYKGDDEIYEAYKFLSLISENPPEAPSLTRKKPKIKPLAKKL